LARREGMVDISDKSIVKREAKACGRIRLRPETVKAVVNGEIPKGDVAESSKVVALNAVKDTSRILPYCHPIPIEWIGFEFKVLDDGVEVCVTVRTTAKTGVEMEALVGTLLALANIWDMTKSLEKDESGQYPYTKITDVRVVYKTKEA
jgi:cyclic pyranopterin phosphate synthase